MVSNPLHEHTLASTRLLMEAFADGRLPDWERFARTADVMAVERGTVLVPPYVHHPYVYLVTRGVLKLRFTESRSERTITFFTEGELATSFNALGAPSFERTALRASPHLSGDPRVWPEGSPFELVAVEHSSVLRASYSAIEELATRSLPWSRMLSAFLATQLVTLCAGLPDSHLATPEERYRSFVARHPELVSRLSQREVAAHIGVTEVGMSRIVKRVTSTLGRGEEPSASRPAAHAPARRTTLPAGRTSPTRGDAASTAR